MSNEDRLRSLDLSDRAQGPGSGEMRKRTYSLVRLCELASFMGGGTPSRAHSEYFNGGIPWVKTTDLNNDIVYSTSETLSVAGVDNSSCKLVPKGSVLVAMYGGFNQIGRTGLLATDSCINQALTAVLPSSTLLDPLFLLEWLNFRVGYWRRFAGSSRKDPNITKGDIGDFPIPKISLAQQQHGARILRTWNTAIQKKECLISLKERVYRGLLRSLISSNTQQIRHLSSFTTRVMRKNASGDGLPLTISGRDGLVSQLQFYDKRIAAESAENYTLLRQGEFAYNRSYSSGYPYGAIKRLDSFDEGIVSSLYLCFALKPDSPVSGDYFVSFCEAGGFNHQIHKIAQEGARNHGLLNVANNDFFHMTIPVPPENEQNRTVEILSTARREIQLLKVELEKIKVQKRGLMQQLLTGRWYGSNAQGASV